MKFLLSLLLLLPAVAPAQPLLQPTSGLATDYEWELQSPNRTLFRDLTPVGRISLRHIGGMGGMLGKKGKDTGEDLFVQADVAFIPGDTVRFFAANISLTNGGVQAESILDAGELPALYSALKYMLQTAGHIIDTDRPDTRVQHRSKSGLTFMFSQRGTEQGFSISWPVGPGRVVERGLEADQFQSLIDLLDLTMFELRRQGAVIQAVVELPR
ncbi:hypothetical protein HZB60_02515 [candidate division KSB1 bacterium]|nr:hypothetical protein [candidate division KSB1 bacterium]